MFKKLGKSFLVMTAALAVAAALCGPASAAQVIKIGWTTSDGPTDPYAITARQFKKALDELAPGKFDVQFFPNRQLGDEKEMLEGMSFGTLHMGVITNAPIASIEPAFQINDLPFLYESAEVAHKALDGILGAGLLQKLEKKNIKGLGFAEGGFRQMINNVRPIKTPADVEGIKWRVMQNPVYIGMFRSLGGNAVPMAWGETFTAVQQGTVDGLEIPIAVIQNNGFYEVCKYMSLTNHTYSALGVLMSKKVFDKLSKADQDIVMKAARQAIVAERQMNAANTTKLTEKLKSEGMAVNKVDDPKAFRDKVEPVYKEFEPSIGAAPFEWLMQSLK